MRTLLGFLAVAASSFCVFVYPLQVPAQTYAPKQIRIDAPPGADTAELTRIAALKSGAPLTKEQIEAALQRLGDTGVFADISYTVDSDALVIKLTGSAATQSLPVRYANFVWWQPPDLEKLVEARVPLFQGKLPFRGTLTDQVEAALTQLLHDKGIDAQVTAVQAGSLGQQANAVALMISQPEVVVGDLQLRDTLPALDPQLETLKHRLHGEDFNIAETSDAIQESVADIYRNAGYLDISSSAPTYSAPRKDLAAYAVDLASTVNSGSLYRVRALATPASPPLSPGEIQKAAEIKAGDPASALALRVAQGEVQKAYTDRGYLDAKTTINVAKNSAEHSVAYSVTTSPGEVYHFASIDTSALSAAQQATFARLFQGAPGAVPDRDFHVALFRAILALHAPRQPKLQEIKDPSNHTLTIALQPATTSTPN